MSYSWIMWLIAIVNIYYLVLKDTVNKKDAEVSEILKILEAAINEAIDSSVKETNNDSKIDLKKLDIHIARIEIIPNFRIIIENDLEDKILEFSIVLSDFKTGAKKREELLSIYKEILKYIYNIEASSLKYIVFHVTKKPVKYLFNKNKLKKIFNKIKG